jgi:hypothetical protein
VENPMTTIATDMVLKTRPDARSGDAAPSSPFGGLNTHLT